MQLIHHILDQDLGHQIIDSKFLVFFKFLTKYCTENIEMLRKGGLVENKCVKL
jgi:hypothetical protein